MSEMLITRYLETEGLDKGRIKDKGIAFDLAWTDYAWRKENGGRPINAVPDTLSDLELHYNRMLDDEMTRLVIAAASKELRLSIAMLQMNVHRPHTDLEVTDPDWVAWREAKEQAFAELETSRDAFPT